MLTAGIAAYQRLAREGGAEPAIVAGHSLGEYTALVAAGALALARCLPLVRFRAQAMQEAVPAGRGAMAAILGLDDDAVRAAAQEAAKGEVVEAVNFNDPRQTVIAGHRAPSTRRDRRLQGQRRQARRAAAGVAPVPLSADAAGRGAPAKLSGRRRVRGAPLSAHQQRRRRASRRDPAAIRDALVRQAAAPVRWVEIVQAHARPRA